MAALRAQDHFRSNAVLPILRTAWHGDCYYKNRRFLAYILLSGAVPGPTGAALLFSWLGWGRLGESRAALSVLRRKVGSLFTRSFRKPWPRGRLLLINTSLQRGGRICGGL